MTGMGTVHKKYTRVESVAEIPLYNDSKIMITQFKGFLASSST